MILYVSVGLKLNAGVRNWRNFPFLLVFAIWVEWAVLVLLCFDELFVQRLLTVFCTRFGSFLVKSVESFLQFRGLGFGLVG